ncbi:peroxisomal membrane anchor protein conserved region-domain-containing protein [Cokeromyces recurvatus]|uniref:peroxisomal membrane anchor protein conserved region-domain-containing protein n=1 Tax=Cokeromyces recurvatus TaxID=90255 RepID=UPI0022204C3A|nr:peroxisomal membrane anchor protein conserved region-domain-containing protein [Cokeromyces recurvatus]KAI7907825.1 peroxisomal membrane anchor protein conserved region-domain-containing protein [Cokeromyces recurvatus]
MSNSSSSSTTNNPPTSQTTQDNSSDAQTTISSSLDSTKSPTNNSIPTPTATTLPSDGLREDLIKQAVSFLSSANVRSADKEKKMAFLQKKGLNQAEIDEAFKRVGDQSIANISTINTIAPAIPLRNYTPSLIPTTQILYYPQPPQPSLPAEKVFALSVILGMGAVGLTASMIGLLKVNFSIHIH